jgi:bacillithiol biosynthesis cysteine-adding enzyme BshC
MYINFSDIPGHNNLFLDYLYEFENVKEFYKYNFRDQDQFQKIFKKINESERINPSLLKKNLLSQYSGLTTSNKTKKNITLLSKDNTLAVVTGQQLGLLGGPIYTFYKIITTLKLSKHLNDKYDDYNFVPVFWMEGDDHDFNEVRSINVIGTANTIKNIGYKEQIDPDDAKKSVGTLELDDALDEFFNVLDDNLRQTDFKDPLLSSLKNYYSIGKTFTTSFRELIHALFDEYGLVILNPSDKKVKEILKPVFKKEIIDFREHTEKLVNVSARLEEVYHAQVKVKPVNLFYSTDDGRYSIEPVENEFRLKRKRISFTQEEILEKVDKESERFSPNVLLRPICQDFLLPTAFYVGGPSEISYFAQVTPLYEFYKLQTPVIYPRSSATLLESNINKTLEKYDISFNDIFMGADELKKKVVDSLTENNVDDVFSETEKEVELAIDRLRERLYDVDKTIADTSKKYRSKIFNSLNELKGKAEQAQNQKFEVTLRQMDRASTMLFPSNNLQERELNYTYFANKYGEGFLKRLYDDLNTDKFEHQVIEL